MATRQKNQNCKKALPWFIPSAAVILASTGLAKMWSSFGNSKLLEAVDPIIGFKFGQLMLVVGAAEIVVVLVCLCSKRKTLAVGLTAWLATSFVVYRLGLWWMGWHRPCGCMGSLTSALHVSEQAADNIMKAGLAYLLIGSYGVLLWKWGQRKIKGGDESTVQSSFATTN